MTNINKLESLFSRIKLNDYKIDLYESMDLPIINLRKYDTRVDIKFEDSAFGSEYISEILNKAVLESKEIPVGATIRGYINWNGLHGIVHYDLHPYSIIALTNDNVNLDGGEIYLDSIDEVMLDYNYQRGVFQDSHREGELFLIKAKSKQIDFSNETMFIEEVLGFCSEYRNKTGKFHNEVMIYEDLPFHKRVCDIITNTGLYSESSDYLTEFSRLHKSRLNHKRGYVDTVTGIEFINGKFDRVSKLINSLGESINGDSRNILSREFSLTNSTNDTLLDRIIEQLTYGIDISRETIIVEKYQEMLELVGGMIYTTMAILGSKLKYLNDNINHPISKFHINSIARRLDNIYGEIDEFNSDLLETGGKDINIKTLQEFIYRLENNHKLKFH